MMPNGIAVATSEPIVLSLAEDGLIYASMKSERRTRQRTAHCLAHPALAGPVDLPTLFTPIPYYAECRGQVRNIGLFIMDRALQAKMPVKSERRTPVKERPFALAHLALIARRFAYFFSSTSCVLRHYDGYLTEVGHFGPG